MIEWQPIETIPYDEPVLMFCSKTGMVFQDFLYDAGTDWLRERGITHWMPIPDLPPLEGE